MSCTGHHSWNSPYLYHTWAPLPAFIPQHYSVPLTLYCGSNAAISPSGLSCTSPALIPQYQPPHISRSYFSAAPTHSLNSVELCSNATGRMCPDVPQTTQFLRQAGTDFQVHNSTAPENVYDDNFVHSARGIPVLRQGFCGARESSCGNAPQKICSNVPEISTNAEPTLLGSSGPIPLERHSKATEEMLPNLENDTNSVPASLSSHRFNSPQTCSEAEEARLDQIRSEVMKIIRISQDLKSVVEMQCDALNATVGHLYVSLETTSFTDVHGRLWTCGGSGSTGVSVPVASVASNSTRQPCDAKPQLSRVWEEFVFTDLANEGKITSSTVNLSTGAVMPSNVADTPLSLVKCDVPPLDFNYSDCPNTSRSTQTCSKPGKVDARTVCGTGLLEESEASIGDNETCKDASTSPRVCWSSVFPELRWWLVCDRCYPFDQGTSTRPTFLKTNIEYKWNLSSLGDRSKSIRDIISYFERNVSVPRLGKVMSHELLTNTSVQEKVSFFENCVPKLQFSRTPDDCQMPGGNRACRTVHTLPRSTFKVDDKAAPDQVINIEMIRPNDDSHSSPPKRFRAPPSGCGLANLDPCANTVCTSYHGGKSPDEIEQLVDLNKQDNEKGACVRSGSSQAGTGAQLEVLNLREKRKKTTSILKKKRRGGISVSILVQDRYGAQVEDLNVREKKKTRRILKKKRRVGRPMSNQGGLERNNVLETGKGVKLERKTLKGVKIAEKARPINCSKLGRANVNHVALHNFQQNELRHLLPHMVMPRKVVRNPLGQPGDVCESINGRETSDDSNGERSRRTCKTRFNLHSGTRASTSGQEPVAFRSRRTGKMTVNSKRTKIKGNKNSIPISKMTGTELHQNVTSSDPFEYTNNDNVTNQRLADRRGRNHSKNDPTKKSTLPPIYFDKRLNGRAIGSACGECISRATSQHMSNFLRRYLHSACHCSNGQSSIASSDDDCSRCRYYRAVQRVALKKRVAHGRHEEVYESPDDVGPRNDGKNGGRINSAESDDKSSSHCLMGTDAEYASVRWNGDNCSTCTDGESRRGRWNDNRRRSYCCSCSGTGNNNCNVNKDIDTVRRGLSNNGASSCNVGKANRKIIRNRRRGDSRRSSEILVKEPADKMSCGENLQAFTEASCGRRGYFYLDEAEMDGLLCNDDICLSC